jgi:hypothetical protein
MKVSDSPHQSGAVCMSANIRDCAGIDRPFA